MAVNPADVFDYFKQGGVSFVAGVPDSLLKYFCAYISDHLPREQHVIAANEGSAVGLATGHYLASGKPALVYLQNSGLGNTINPVLSLADPAVYGIPMVLMIGWRGAPGVKDEPQHVKQGEVTISMLESMDIPVFIGDADSNWESLVQDAVEKARDVSGPVALVVKPDTFQKYDLVSGVEASTDLPSREAAIEGVLEHIPRNTVIVSTTGMASRELFELRIARGESHATDFLTVGSMGHASQIALGIALTQPTRPVLCLDGDGAIIMHTGALSTVGQLQPRNMVHVVLNNGAHDSVGGQPTASTNVDFVQLAKASGYSRAITVDTVAKIGGAIAEAFSAGEPTFVELRIRPGARSNLGRPTSSPRENKAAFMETLRT